MRMTKLRRVKPLTMLHTWSRRVSVVNILCMFLFMTVVLTAYLHGLIEVDSNRLVINIASGSSGDRRQLEFDESVDLSESSLSRSQNNDERRGRYNLKENVLINMEANLIKKTTTRNTDYRGFDKNVTNFFLTIERNRGIIMSTLPTDEIDELMRLKNAMLIAASINANRDENPSNDDGDRGVVVGGAPPGPQINEQTVPIPNPNIFFLNATRNYPEPDQVPIEPFEFRPITRELLVRFLKVEKFRLQKAKNIKTVRQLLNEFIAQNDLNPEELPDIWHKYFVYINELRLFNNSRVVDDILTRISTSPVTNCYEKEKGTQIKLLLNLEDGTDVLVKPMKVPRDYETPPDHFYFVDFERHHAEIAAFHVDRLLGFYRVPPTVGRVFNMTTELWEKSEEELAKTFFYSPAGNVCFTGHCSYYCDTTHAICGRPRDKMEGSVQVMLPSKPIVKWQVFNHPYRRTYTKRKKALWEVDDSYCESKLLQDVTYSSKLILDIMDMAVFDFITGNMDRHHYEKMTSLGNDSFLLHLDNGRSFGKAYHDEMSILAPLKQCCLLRFSTFEKLKFLYMNNFSSLLDASLRHDPLYPILTEAHLKAVDRRLLTIFYQLIECSRRYKPFQVIVDDGY